jgi:hypothetical protein
LGSWNAVPRFDESVLVLLADDVHAQLDAFIADEYGRTGNQLTDFMLALAAERAIEGVLLLSHVFSTFHARSSHGCSCFGPLFASDALPICGDVKTRDQSQHASVQQIKNGLMDRTRLHLASGAIATVDERARNSAIQTVYSS